MEPRWNINKKEWQESPEDVKEFLRILDNLCRTYKVAIEHEDVGGSFIIKRSGDYDLIQTADFEE